MSTNTLPGIGVSPPSLAFAPAVREAGAKMRTTTFDGELPMLPGIHVPLRSLLVEGERDAILISPVGSAEERRAVGGTPVTLVAPSLLHHKFLATAIDQLEPRDVWGPPGLAEKKPELAKAAGGLRVFGSHPWPYDDTLAFQIVHGAPKRNEVVFFHRQTKTIYTADLVFNILEPSGALSPLAFRMMGIYKRFAVAKMWKKWVEDEAAFRRSISVILSWDFDRIVMSHGAIVERGGKQLLTKALTERGLI